MKPKKLSPRTIKEVLSHLEHKRETERERYTNAIIKINEEEMETQDRCPHSRVIVYTDIYDPREYRCTTCRLTFRKKPAGSKEVKNG
jgi:hypothetical protein